MVDRSKVEAMLARLKRYRAWEVSDEAVCSLLHTHLSDLDRFASYILTWMETETGPRVGESEVKT